MKCTLKNHLIDVDFSQYRRTAYSYSIYNKDCTDRTHFHTHCPIMQHATLYNIHAPCGASRSWASEQAKKGHGKHIRYSCPSWKKSVHGGGSRTFQYLRWTLKKSATIFLHAACSVDRPDHVTPPSVPEYQGPEPHFLSYSWFIMLNGTLHWGLIMPGKKQQTVRICCRLCGVLTCHGASSMEME